MSTFFLRYVAERLMGPPTYESGGRATWPCPFCDDQTAFSVLPHRDGFKDRYRCHRCGAWGDEFDLSKLFFDRENFDERRVRLQKWSEDFTRDSESQSPKVFTPVDGERRTIARHRKDEDDDYRVDEHEFSEAADAALKDLKEWVEAKNLDLAEAAAVGEMVLRLCDKHDIRACALAGRLGFVVWVEESNREHMASCKDPDCDYLCCRRARGLGPLPPLPGSWLDLEAKAKLKEKLKGPTPVSTPKTRSSKKGDKSPNYYPARSSRAGRKKRESP